MPTVPRMLLVTGLWVPIVGRAPSDGKRLADRLAAAYPAANLTWHSWWDVIDPAPLLDASPLILIGHSFGGAACVRLAKQLVERQQTVNELLLLDPVPTDVAGRWMHRQIDIPSNVASGRCIARKTRLYPRSKLARGANITNETRSIPHDRFLQHRDIVAIIESMVKQFA